MSLFTSFVLLGRRFLIDWGFQVRFGCGLSLFMFSDSDFYQIILSFILSI